MTAVQIRPACCDAVIRTTTASDRKHFLLGKYLTDDWLSECDPAHNPLRLRPPTNIFDILPD